MLVYIVSYDIILYDVTKALFSYWRGRILIRNNCTRITKKKLFSAVKNMLVCAEMAARQQCFEYNDLYTVELPDNKNLCSLDVHVWLDIKLKPVNPF